ncbi:hypothetical protein BHMPCIPO_06331 [Ensifer sesbaniae]|nr:hypothetical protein [Ensifer sesbaniae]
MKRQTGCARRDQADRTAAHHPLQVRLVDVRTGTHDGVANDDLDNAFLNCRRSRLLFFHQSRALLTISTKLPSPSKELRRQNTDPSSNRRNVRSRHGRLLDARNVSPGTALTGNVRGLHNSGRKPFLQVV